YRFGVDDYERGLQRAFGMVDLGIWQCDLPPLPAKNEVTHSLQGEMRTWFPDAQVLILRPQGELAPKAAEVRGLAVAMKGGHNAELHNHNDVGSYVVVHRGTLPLLDVGSETYTRKTFSAQRYESDALNSWGHSVPVVAGKLQKTGRAAEAKILKIDSRPEKEVFHLDLRAVYDVPELQRLTRCFTYSRDGETSFEIVDEVEFSSPQTFETALVTSLAWKREGFLSVKKRLRSSWKSKSRLRVPKPTRGN
ncbi:MAG: heparinase II/III family protein, partial [Planctomycetia bacterium]|nr:heparinase II/III family protein [Planctomycetia bacterium]